MGDCACEIYQQGVVVVLQDGFEPTILRLKIGCLSHLATGARLVLPARIELALLDRESSFLPLEDGSL